MKLRKLLNIRVAILCLWALALIAIVIIIGPDRVLGSYQSLTPQSIKDTVDSFGALSVLIYLLACLVRPLLFLPVSPFTIASGFIFGLGWGFLWSMVGSTASALFIFFLSRYMLHDFVTKNLKGRYPSIDKMLEGGSWSFMIFLRMVPILPFDLVSCFAGTSNMKFRDFLIGTILGEVPGAFVLVVLGTTLDNIGSSFFFLALALAVLVFAGLELIRRWAGKRRKELSQ
ncbi:MAG TPA: TVP38/TMEM64 family protein [Methanocella sp.]